MKEMLMIVVPIVGGWITSLEVRLRSHKRDVLNEQEKIMDLKLKPVEVLLKEIQKDISRVERKLDRSGK